MGKGEPGGQGTVALEAWSRGFTGIAVGFASAAITVLTNVPDLMEKHLSVAALYAVAVPHGIVGALGAGIASLVFWAWAYDAKIGRPETPSSRRYGMITVGIATAGFAAMIWGGAGLLALAFRLAEVVGGS